MDNTAAAIDFMVLRYGATDATARAKCLQYLQAAVDEVWNLDNWWFKEETTVLAIQAADYDYTLEAETESILTLIEPDGETVFFMDTDSFNRLFRPNMDITGAPVFYTCDGLDKDNGLHKILLWPVPSTSGNCILTRRIKDRVIADSTANKSRIPYNYMFIPVYRALQLIAQKEKQLAEGEAYRAEFDRGLQIMTADNQRRRTGVYK